MTKSLTINPIPTELAVRQKSGVLDMTFDDGAVFSLPFEYLRVYSPSAEVRGHGAGQEVLQLGKRNVGISALEPVGNYAVQPTFTDGHDTGLYTFDYLYQLGSEQAALWQDYLQRLANAGFVGDSGREPGAAIAGAPTKAPSCGHKH
ncbi:gamma-butyrobetaine hydroxylase-like domain-containing protein [Massilia psychrophila]|jgi:DUF971 family protein|uniref:gamma-butyrobetaine hydroxylase-like domain-containing protein n=1 Tax=Massilia psychrophila TaxID=1603353 RepID=UPI0015D5216D|nr:DUF971 domain-containing protein [Massilia psychrophila]GGE82909.1 hypothetical protein GCM10008020_29790 [Massilia psychrophila]